MLYKKGDFLSEGFGDKIRMGVDLMRKNLGDIFQGQYVDVTFLLLKPSQGAGEGAFYG